MASIWSVEIRARYRSSRLGSVLKSEGSEAAISASSRNVPGPAQAAEDGVVGRDLDGRRVGTGLSVPALGGHAGGGDLDEVLGHPVAREDGRRARAGWL